ncbi:uncharacterized protein LOC121650699 [Melanotaenia boesemani]|uniref:uncharacterized protein LOC121650699 n=1 Tax=Melanotaenia boesemani TaxID=1250792 RepID=UPI001C03C3B1|nr:uncharacterized protein LOC121650699 [Melanotaenia boesemani]
MIQRKEIISDDLPVSQILERWPALQVESQISAEFHRITNINLKNHFYAVLDQHVRRLQTLLRKKAARTGKVSGVLDQFFRVYDLQEEVDVNIRHAAVLHALPAYLCEDASSFLKTWNAGQSDEPYIEDIPLGLVLVGASSTDATLFSPEKVALVLESNMIIDLPTLADAFAVLFGLIYALHLSYPKTLANTFDFTQKVLMGLEDGKLKPKVLSLKNELLAED